MDARQRPPQWHSERATSPRETARNRRVVCLARQPFPRLIIVGIDGAVPQLIFDRFRTIMPVINGLSAEAIIGDLESVTPTSSIPAWPALFSGRDPGMLGVYGARQRLDHGYGPEVPVTSRFFPNSFVWDLVAKAGKRSIVVGVPPSVPLRSIDGVMVGCSLLPDNSEVFTAPAELSAPLAREFGPFLPDLRGLDPEHPERALAQAQAITTQRFALLTSLFNTENWQLAVVVDPTIDRLQHAFWKSPDVIRAHYAVLDAEVGQLVSKLERDDVLVIVSDHGSRASRGTFAVNDWLIREGFLKLRTPVTQVTPIDRVDVDWPKSQAWADGGSAMRLMLNVKEREPQGCVEPRQYEVVRNRLKRQLELLHGPDDKTLSVQVQKPEEIYQSIRRVAPDLFATAGGMAWRCTGHIGHSELFLPPVEGVSTGNHSASGLFLVRWPKHGPNGKRQGIRLLDLFPTFLNMLGLPAQSALPGHAIIA